jgi:hypothetical protein
MGSQGLRGSKPESKPTTRHRKLGTYDATTCLFRVAGLPGMAAVLALVLHSSSYASERLERSFKY